MGEGKPIEQAVTIVMRRTGVGPCQTASKRIAALNANREPTSQDPDYRCDM
jgi:hypothetical protein